MVSQSARANIEAQKMIINAKPNMNTAKKLLKFAHRLITAKGYKLLKSQYFTSLRHKILYYRPRYFYASPGERICVVDILVVHATLKDKHQLITKLELLNRDCQSIRSILLDEYQNSARVFSDPKFGLEQFRFLHLLVTKRIKPVPTYNNSLQALFSVKPLIITLEGRAEFDLQQDSRVDIIPIEKIQQYLNLWDNEIAKLGKEAYRADKFKHFDFLNTYDKLIATFLILYAIPTELNIFLQWNLWFLSFYFFIFLAIIASISNPIHSFIRYKAFSKICREEITTSKWIDQCNYLKPFLIRSKQLLVQPLEKRQSESQSINSNRAQNVHQLFSTSPSTNSIDSSTPFVERPEPIDNNVGGEKIVNTESVSKELIPDTPLIKSSQRRGIKSLLQRKSKPKANIGIYKEQLGDLYSKLKTTSDFEVFKITALRIITLILTCQWFKSTGTPPVNIRIREVSDNRIDHFEQVENLLTQFLERFPDAINIDEVYRLATIINLGHLNQKMIDHVEWKLEDWLLNFKLLPDSKMKVLEATHSKRTAPHRVIKRFTDKVDSTLSQFKNLTPEPKPKPPPEVKEQSTEKIEPKPQPIPKPPLKPPSKEEQHDDQSSIKRFKLPDKNKESCVEVELVDAQAIIQNAKEQIPDSFIGETIKDYYRFKFIIEDIGYRSYGTPVCVFSYDSSKHPEQVVDEFKEIAEQISGDVSYIIFDYADVKPEITENEGFQPLTEPTIWIRDKVLEINESFKFTPSGLANFLAGLRKKISDKDAPKPSPNIEMTETESHGFEKIDSDSEEELSVDDLDDVDIDSNLPETIRQTAEIYESEENEGPIAAAMDELEQMESSQELEAINQEIIIHHETPFLKNQLFKQTNNRDNGIVIDTNNFLLSFLVEANMLRIDYGFIPNFYLMDVLDYIYRELDKLGFGPIIFYTDPDFYIYLMPEPQKSRKIQNFATKEKYLLYESTKEESNLYENLRKLGLFRQIEKGGDTDMEILIEASTHNYKILSNDQYSQPRYGKFQEYITNNKFSFKIKKTAVSIYSPNNRLVGEPLYLIDLPDNIREKVSTLVINEQKAVPSIRRIDNVNTDNMVMGLSRKWNVFKNLQTQQITKIPKIETSVIEIVFGAFHAKIGPIILFPTCNDCLEKIKKDKSAINGISEFDLRHPLKLTNCKCPLPKTGIPRDLVRNQHLNSTLKDEGFQSREHKHTFLSYRWSRKEDFSARQELSWAILVYMNDKNPIYNIERDLIRDFLRNYEFNIDNGLKDLIDEGLKGEKFDEKFYELLYEHLMNLIHELTTQIHNTLNQLKE